MGTLFAGVAILASLFLVVLPVGTVTVFYTVVAILAGLVGAALFRPHPGFMGAATLFGWFAIMIVHPFSLNTQQFNGLNRLARRGDEEAAALIALYERLMPYATWAVLTMTVLIVALFVITARRHPAGAHPYLLRESDAVATLCTRAGILASLAFAPMMLIIVYDVLQRKYLGVNPAFIDTQWYKTFTSTKIQEMQWHLHAVLFLMCLGYGYVKDAHVRIELVRDTLGPKTRVWIELLGTLLFLVPYCYVILKYGIDNAMRSYAIGESSAAQTGLEYRFIIKSFLPLGFAFLALAGMSVALKCIVYLFGPPDLRGAAAEYSGTQKPTAVEA